MNNYPTEINGRAIEYLAISEAPKEIKAKFSPFQVGSAIGFWKFAKGWEWHLIGGSFGTPSTDEMIQKILAKIEAQQNYEASVETRKAAEAEAHKPYEGRWCEPPFRRGDDSFFGSFD